MQKKIKIGILGVSGYTGLALLNLLSNHPQAEITTLASSQHIGKNISDLYTTFSGLNLPNFVSSENINFAELNCLFTATPNGIASQIAPQALKHNCKLIDLAADFRLKDKQVFEKWYGFAPDENILQKAVYGLTEWNRAEIQQAQILANPGCYPTVSALGIIPLLKNNLIENNFCIIDAKSGATGAGKKAEESILFSEMSESFSAYKVLAHRHTPEIEQSLELFGKQKMPVRFTPHLLPIKRGILSTIYLQPKNKITNLALEECFKETYKNENFIKCVGEPPKTKDVYNSNNCYIYSVYDEHTNLIIIISVIDNLMKGAAGQAVQNFNLMFDLPETLGLTNLRLIP